MVSRIQPPAFSMKRSLLTLLSVFALAATAWSAGLELKKGDHIAILGNTLPDRMQHSAWLDTLIYAANPDKDLVIRTLAASADEVNTWHRSENFGTRDEWLKRVGADVIIAYYGFDESFKGEAGLAQFKSDLTDFIKQMKSQNFSGKGAPRLVLVSPIAAEKQSNPDIVKPDGINANLKLYVPAIAEIAKANEVPFVDLFSLSQQIYGESKQPMTFNGIHLTLEADKIFAPYIFKGLFGETAPNIESYDKLHSAVVDRNEMWHSRYRTVDGYNVYGGRSGLAYAPHVGAFHQNEKEPAKPYVSNYQVMQQEMAVRDVMTANRDQRVWAVAKGGDMKVDDSNVPEVEKVTTNLPIGGETFNKTPMSGFKIDPKTELVEFPSGEEVLKHMKTPPGIKVELFADETMFPELIKPVQMNFDTKGRLWVSAWPNYPERTPWSKDGDKLLILEDTKGTGKADKCTTFMNTLNCPTGFQFYKDGVLVMRSPDLLFARDTNGDGKADKIVRVLSGLDAADSHHETNSMCYEPGGAIYCSDGVFHRTQVETPEGPVRNIDGCIYRWEPRTAKFTRYAAYGFANPHGRVFDYWGNDIITDATGNASYFGPGFSGFVSEPNKHAKYEEFWKRPSRPCAGTTILSSRHFPDDFNGNFLDCNVISIQGIFRVKMTEEGSGIRGDTITYDNKGQTLSTLVECDPGEVGVFRPCAVAVAPDGSLYFADWSNAIIGHMQHHLRDPNRDHLHGRIYRVTFTGRPLLKPKKVDGQPIAALLDLLKEPENDVRTRAKIELDKHDTKDVIAAVNKWVKQFDPKKVEDAHPILEALWVHQWHNVVDLDLINTVLHSPEPRARAQAVRVICYMRDRIPNALQLLQTAANDPAPRVRLEAVRAASFFSGEDAGLAMAAASDALKYDTDYYIDYCFKETLKQLQSVSTRKFVFTDPVVRAKIFAGLSDAELGGMPSDSSSVVLAKLERRSYDVIKRQGFVTDLARLNKTDNVSAALSALSGLDESGNDAAASELVKVLVMNTPADLAKARSVLAKLAVSSKHEPARRAAWAAMILADGKADGVWAEAKSDTDREALIHGIGAVPDPTLRAQFQPKLAELATTAKGQALKSVLGALPLMGPQNAAANFAVLAKYVVDGSERQAAGSAIMALPRDSWDKGQASAIAHSILDYAKKLEAKQRAEQDFIELNQLAMEMASLAGDSALRKELRGLGVPVFVVKTVREQMRYDNQRIVVEKGKDFEIILQNGDVMPHNMCVVEPGKHLEVGMSTMVMPPDKKDKEGRSYMPDTKQFKVFAATKLLEPEQKEKISVKGIGKEGEYEYVCTFPGHSMSMWGKLIVTKDVDAYLAEHPTFKLDIVLPGAQPPAAGK